MEELAAHEPPDSFAVGAFDGADLVAVALVGRFGEPDEWRVRGMAALPAVRGQGTGSAILGTLIDHVREQGGSVVWANVRTPARSLYERAGFRATSEEVELPHIGPHVMMRLELTTKRRAPP